MTCRFPAVVRGGLRCSEELIDAHVPLGWCLATPWSSATAEERTVEIPAAEHLAAQVDILHDHASTAEERHVVPVLLVVLKLGKSDCQRHRAGPGTSPVLERGDFYREVVYDCVAWKFKIRSGFGPGFKTLHER